VLETLRARVRANAKDLAQQGVPRKPFYLTGRVGQEAISLHAEGERVIFQKGDGSREEVDLTAPGRRGDDADVVQELPEPLAVEGHHDDAPGTDDDAIRPPGTSPLDGALDELQRELPEPDDEEEQVS
jgi:hypothetical protein